MTMKKSLQNEPDMRGFTCVIGSISRDTLALILTPGLLVAEHRRQCGEHQKIAKHCQYECRFNSIELNDGLVPMSPISLERWRGREISARPDDMRRLSVREKLASKYCLTGACVTSR